MNSKETNHTPKAESSQILENNTGNEKAVCFLWFIDIRFTFDMEETGGRREGHVYCLPGDLPDLGLCGSHHVRDLVTVVKSTERAQRWLEFTN
jgi:hypothetical protein